MSNIEKPTKDAIIEIINKGGYIELGKPFQREIKLAMFLGIKMKYWQDLWMQGN